uniref:Uncharacterized protein n=1 Tax=Arundo donax TaxID=35708 RepID=A0A0A9C7K1_ARUDO
MLSHRCSKMAMSSRRGLKILFSSHRDSNMYYFL